MGGYGYGGMQQPQMQGGWGNAQQPQWGGGYQPQQNFGGFGGSPFGGGQQWNGGGQNWGGGYGYNQPQQQPYFGGMMGYQPEQRQSYGQFNQGMNQDNRQAYSSAMNQGIQQFQGQMAQQDQGQQGFAQNFNKTQGGSQREDGPDGGSRIAAGGVDKSAMMNAIQSGGQSMQSQQQIAPSTPAATQGNEMGRSGGDTSQLMAGMQQFSGGQQQMNGNGSLMGMFSGGGWKR